MIQYYRNWFRTPLLLSVLTLGYHGRTVEDLLRGNVSTARQQVFETYTQRMLQRRGTKPLYTQQKTKRWLAWLARQLAQHNQTDFYIEHMQPDWLPEGRLYPLYRGTVTRLVDGLTFGLVGGLAYRLFFELFGSGSIIIVFFGLLSVLIGKLESKKRPAEVVLWSWVSMQRDLVDKLLFGLTGGLIL